MAYWGNFLGSQIRRLDVITASIAKVTRNLHESLRSGLQERAVKGVRDEWHCRV
jgi:hypothetical protein